MTARDPDRFCNGNGPFVCRRHFLCVVAEIERAVWETLEPIGSVGFDARRFASDVDRNTLGLCMLLSPFYERGGYSLASVSWINSHGAQFPRWSDVSRRCRSAAAVFHDFRASSNGLDRVRRCCCLCSFFNGRGRECLSVRVGVFGCADAKYNDANWCIGGWSCSHYNVLLRVLKEIGSPDHGKR